MESKSRESSKARCFSSSCLTVLISPCEKACEAEIKNKAKESVHFKIAVLIKQSKVRLQLFVILNDMMIK